MTSWSGGLRALLFGGALAGGALGCLVADLATDEFDACLVDSDCPDDKECRKVDGVRECVAPDSPPEGEGEGEGAG